MIILFVEFLAIYINENMRNIIKNAKLGLQFCQLLNKP